QQILLLLIFFQSKSAIGRVDRTRRSPRNWETPSDREGNGILEYGKSEDLPNEIVASSLPGLRRLR
ncbi:MAG: hypothetical protein ACOVOJ_14535, partial [Pirellula sp.]